jgi:addiction module HigA family antidote
MATKTLRHSKIEPAHPGEFLREITIPATGLSKSEIARRLHISRQTLHDVLACRQEVTASLAHRLGKLFGDGPNIWLGMQMEHNIWKAARDMKNELAAIKPLRAA